MRWFAFLLLILLMAAVTVYSILRTPSAQKLAGRLAADYLSQKLGTEVYLDKIRISEFLLVEINGLEVNDNHHNPLLKAGVFTIGLREISIQEHHIWIRKLELSDAGFFLHRYTSDTLVNLDNLFASLSTSSSTDTVSAPATDSPGKPWTIYIDELSLDGISFGYTDDREEHPGDRMDFTDILVTDLVFEAKDVTMIGDSISADIRKLSLAEKSGLKLNEFSAAVSVSPTGIRAKNLALKTDRIATTMNLEFLFRDFGQMDYFIDSVYINAMIEESVLTLADLACFAPELANMEDPIMFSGDIKGYISDFAAKGFRFNLGNYTEFEGDVAMKGLPDIYATYADLDIRSFNVTTEDVEQFNLPVPGGNLSLPPSLKSAGMIAITGRYKGVYNDFKTNLQLTTDIGSINVTGELKEDTLARKTTYSGNLSVKSLNLQAVSGEKDLGLADVELDFEGTSLDPEKIDIHLNGWVENLEYMDYRYEKIIIGGRLHGKSYDGRLIILDPSLNLSFTGKVDFRGELPAFDFMIDIETAKLYDLHLSDKSPDMNLEASITGDFSGIQPDDFKGEIHIENLVFHENNSDYKLENLDLVRVRKPGIRDITTLRSDFVDIDMTGTLTLRDFSDKFNILIDSYNGITSTETAIFDSTMMLDFDIRLKNIDPVTEVFFPDIKLSQGARVKGNIDFSLREIGLDIHADSLLAYGIKFEDIAVKGSTKNNRFNLDASIAEIVLSEMEDSTLIGLPNFELKAGLGQDSLAFAINWDNQDVATPNQAEIEGFLLFPSPGRIEGKISQAEANLLGHYWRIEGNNYIVLDPSYKDIKDLVIYRDNESLTVDGRLSDQPADTLSVTFKEWDLSNFNRLIEGADMSVAGVINGKVGLFMNDSVPNVFAGLKIEDFYFNDVLFGDVNLNTRWLESDNALAIDVDMFNDATSEDPYRILGLNGLYYPFDEKQNFDLDVTAQNLDISVMEPMLSSFSSHLAGFATGKLSLDGTLEKPSLTGKLKLQRAELKVDYLNVTYSFSNEVIFDKDFIHFDNVTIYDPNSNQATLNGGIRHKYFKDFVLDINIDPEKLMAIDLNRYQNEVFYGRAFATGKVSLKGPFNQIAIVVDARTEKGTKVTIPINYSVDVSQGNFIVFTTEDTTQAVMEQKDIQVEGVSLDIALNINRNADIEISLPGNIGYIKASGNGDLRLGVDRNGYLTLNGAYLIQTGLFLFSLEQLVSRRFEILENSSISWTGDINDAEVNIVARYRLRTSLEGLGSSLIDPEAANQKVNVFTDIRMTGSLFNPDLSFGIYFPNMQEQDKQAVYAVLDTNDAGLMNQQALSLLVLNSFSTSGANVNNPVNPASIMSNTLSSMLSQISNDFNIGINYVPGDNVSSEQLEVALSTQLLNDRLLIDGNIDVSSDNATTQNTSAIVGDVNVEYKLTKDGRFRVKAFNRSNDLSLLNDYSPYTQGVGIFYRKEFNNITELFTRRKPKDKSKGQ